MKTAAVLSNNLGTDSNPAGGGYGRRLFAIGWLWILLLCAFTLIFAGKVYAGTPPPPITVNLAVDPNVVSEDNESAGVTASLDFPPFVQDDFDEATVQVSVAAPGTTAGLNQDYEVPDAVGDAVRLDMGPAPSPQPVEDSFEVRSLPDGQLEDDETVVFEVTGCTATVNGGPYPCDPGTGAVLTITQGGLGLSVDSGNGQVTATGLSLAPFVVKATSGGVAVAGVPILWTLENGDGTLSNQRSLTDNQGLASSTLTPRGNGGFLVKARIANTSESVAFTSALNPLGTLPGLTPNQRSMANTLDALCPRLDAIGATRTLTSEQQDLLNQCQILQRNALTDPNAARQGIVALTPDQASAPRKMASQVTGTQMDNVLTRLLALRKGAKGISLSNLTIKADSQSINGDMVTGLLGQLGHSGGGASADDAGFERLGVFLNGNIDLGDKDRTGNEEGFEFQTLGLTAGIDYRFLDGLVLGAALGYGISDVDIDANRGDLDASAWTGMLYGTYYATDHFYLEGSASYGWGDFDQTRDISYELLGGARQAKADFNGTQYAFMLGAGYDFIRGEGILDLYGRLRYLQVDIDGYRERGASGLDLDIGSQEATSFRSILGVNFTRAFSTARAVLVPQAWFEWIHEFEDGDDEVTGVFANDPSRIAFAMATDSFDTDFFRLGLGLGAQFGQGRTAFVSYEFAMGLEDYREQNLNLGVRVEF